MKKISAAATRRPPARLRLAKLLEEEILSGRIKPGTRLQQLVLAQRLKISQSAVREALQELEYRGLLRKVGRSWWVTRLEEDELVEYFQVRALLEPYAYRLAASHWSEEATRRLQSCIERMELAAQMSDYSIHWAADVEFHQTVWDAQPNRCLRQLLRMVCLPIFANGLLRHAQIPASSYRRSLRWHQLLLRMLRTGEGAATERAARRAVREFLHLNLKDFAA
ncbi:MAG: GntR family transcriptional regulator [Bryobacteraceae bacterium]